MIRVLRKWMIDMVNCDVAGRHEKKTHTVQSILRLIIVFLHSLNNNKYMYIFLLSTIALLSTITISCAHTHTLSAAAMTNQICANVPETNNTNQMESKKKRKTHIIYNFFFYITPFLPLIYDAQTPR